MDLYNYYLTITVLAKCTFDRHFLLVVVLRIEYVIKHVEGHVLLYIVIFMCIHSWNRRGSKAFSVAAVNHDVYFNFVFSVYKCFCGNYFC